MSGNKIVVDISAKPMITNPDGTKFKGIPTGQVVPTTEAELAQAKIDADRWEAQKAIIDAKSQLPNLNAQIKALWTFALTGDNSQVVAIDNQIKVFNKDNPDHVVNIGD